MPALAVLVRQAYDFRCDLWSLGIFAFAILVGKFPFNRTPSANLDTGWMKALNKAIAERSKKAHRLGSTQRAPVKRAPEEK